MENPSNRANEPLQDTSSVARGWWIKLLLNILLKKFVSDSVSLSGLQPIDYVGLSSSEVCVVNTIDQQSFQTIGFCPFFPSQRNLRDKSFISFNDWKHVRNEDKTKTNWDAADVLMILVFTGSVNLSFCQFLTKTLSLWNLSSQFIFCFFVLIRTKPNT